MGAGQDMSGNRVQRKVNLALYNHAVNVKHSITEKNSDPLRTTFVAKFLKKHHCTANMDL